MIQSRRIFLLFLAIVCLGHTTGTSAVLAPGQVPPAPASVADAQRVLTRAREALGGVDRLAAVKTLVVEGVRLRSPGSPHAEGDPYGFKLMLPDRYQSLRSMFRHTIDGGEFWMNERAGDILVDADIRAVAERSTRWNFIYHCLLFLTKVPESIRADSRYVGAMADDADKREWIEVTASGFRTPLKIGFDRATGLPRAVRSTGTEGESVDTLSGYRAVDGILFPFVIEDRLGANQAVTTISSIIVNAGVVAADFARR